MKNGLIEEGWDLLAEIVSGGDRLEDSGRFERQSQYPKEACWELIVNALVHRNYLIGGRAVELDIFPDRLEVTTPGGLLSTISLVDLKTEQGVHDSRNLLIARVMREFGYVREMGEGMRRIFAAMKRVNLAAPELEEISGVGFKVILKNQSKFSEKVLVWLSQYDGFPINNEQKAILACGFSERLFSTQEVLDSLGIDSDKFQKLSTPLVQLGLLKKVVSSAEVNKRLKKKRGLLRREVKVWRVLSARESLENRGIQKKNPAKKNSKPQFLDSMNKDFKTKESANLERLFQFRVDNISKNVDPEKLSLATRTIKGITVLNVYMMPKKIFGVSLRRLGLYSGSGYVTLMSARSPSGVAREISLLSIWKKKVRVRKWNIPPSVRRRYLDESIPSKHD